MPSSTTTQPKRGMAAQQLADQLRVQILSGHIKPGTAIPSIRDLGEQYSVSHQTAYQATRTLTSEGLLNQQQGRGTFVCDLPADANQKHIGVIINRPEGPSLELEAAFDSFWIAAGDELQKHGAKPLFPSSRTPVMPNMLDDILETLDGLITDLSFTNRPGVTEALEAWDKPVVLVKHDDICPFIKWHQIVAEPKTGLNEAIEHLKKKGHQRILVISSERNRDRLNCYRQMAQLKNLPHEPSFEFEQQVQIGDLGRQAGQLATRRLLDAHPDCKAIIALGDFLAFGAVDEIRYRGLTPGKDIDLIGYDDLESAGILPFDKPFLTTIGKPRGQAGREAARVCLRSIEDPNNTIWIAKLPTHLIVRQSG